LLEIDEVLESAVVGSPHPIKGQEVKAFVVLVPVLMEQKNSPIKFSIIAENIWHHIKFQGLLNLLPNFLKRSAVK
jgi:acyl-coenzyme A synthetase/AMP-(fatty) acid ligase